MWKTTAILLLCDFIASSSANFVITANIVGTELFEKRIICGATMFLPNQLISSTKCVGERNEDISGLRVLFADKSKHFFTVRDAGFTSYLTLQGDECKFILSSISVEVSYSTHVPNLALSVLKNKQIWRDEEVVLEFQGVSVLTVDKAICERLYEGDLVSEMHCGQVSTRDLNQMDIGCAVTMTVQPLTYRIIGIVYEVFSTLKTDAIDEVELSHFIFTVPKYLGGGTQNTAQTSG